MLSVDAVCLMTVNDVRQTMVAERMNSFNALFFIVLVVISVKSEKNDLFYPVKVVD